jgi:hypothetical protein
MNKKFGIVAAVLGGILLLCCLGGFFFINGALSKVGETIKADQAFLDKALKATAKNWDESEFSLYADESFNTPEKRETTKKLFSTLKQRLGSLVSLGTIEPLTRGRAFRTGTQKGADQGFFVSFRAKAKFEKGNGVFEVMVKNNKDKHTIYEISLNPDTLSADDPAANNATK